MAERSQNAPSDGPLRFVEAGRFVLTKRKRKGLHVRLVFAYTFKPCLQYLKFATRSTASSIATLTSKQSLTLHHSSACEG